MPMFILRLSQNLTSNCTLEPCSHVWLILKETLLTYEGIEDKGEEGKVRNEDIFVQSYQLFTINCVKSFRKLFHRFLVVS